MINILVENINFQISGFDGGKKCGCSQACWSFGLWREMETTQRSLEWMKNVAPVSTVPAAPTPLKHHFDGIHLEGGLEPSRSSSGILSPLPCERGLFPTHSLPLTLWFQDFGVGMPRVCSLSKQSPVGRFASGRAQTMLSLVQNPCYCQDGTSEGPLFGR